MTLPAALRLLPSDQELFQALLGYHDLTTKAEKQTALLALLQRDRAQVIVKSIAQAAFPQTAFNFALWMLNHDLVTLDWLYDITYRISTQGCQETIDLGLLYGSLKHLSAGDQAVVLGQTEAALKAIRLDELDLAALIKTLEPGVAISFLSWFVTFKKITTVDLEYLSQIVQKVKPAAAAPQETTEIQSQPLIPEPHIIQLTLEDKLLDLNLQLGGTETEILPKVLDRFLFRRTREDKVVYRPNTRVVRLVCAGEERREIPVPVRSAKTWPPGVYVIYREQESLQLMRLPDNEFYEILPLGPDPYLRAETIARMVKEGQR
ncbi:hypothetical protein RHJ63_05630 [Thermosynechococcus sp. JY1334]|uniref:hypothetical protein n=1 Tax=unclassified Thermosynechococcus TaxID=2622553 RepID=UPI00267393DB|nr:MULTISPECIES: hypothetical protein [unclassified Thermosynechococcus]MDR7897790.1 hypothetical protein [Thermosynechococcus sp. JY1332]MDR7905189.1 hypothetical protein [Thermosynechococcus sp. JY1334]WKT87406.1 hypothetical protein QYC30_05605 [Thermosynechococcus sp. JY1339]WNC56348.1 hypothetical protein RHJ31_05590 [Thermosynechococcus sp. JY1331]